MAQEKGSEDLPELAELYDALRQDAKRLTNDLLEGIEMWKTAAGYSLCIAVLAFFLTLITVYPSIMKLFTVIQPILSLGLGILGLGVFVYFRRTYSRLKKRYVQLYEASKKMK